MELANIKQQELLASLWFLCSGLARPTSKPEARGARSGSWRKVEANLSEDESRVKRVADQTFLDGRDGGRTTAEMSCKQTGGLLSIVPSQLTQNSELFPVHIMDFLERRSPVSAEKQALKDIFTERFVIFLLKIAFLFHIEIFVLCRFFVCYWLILLQTDSFLCDCTKY